MTDDFMMRNTGCLSKETCEFLINYFNKNEDISFAGGTEVDKNGNVISKLDDLEIKINIFNFNDELREGISTTISKYVEKYPLTNTAICKWEADEYAFLMRYEPGKSYDSIHCENGGIYYSKRIFAWMIYLNTIKDGGGTEFIHQNKTLSPIEGDMYIWPAHWTHMHRGVVAPNDRKYLLTGWVSFKDI